MGMCEQTKVISGEWRALTDEQRKIYDDKAVKDKERYERQKTEFEETGKFTPVTADNSDGKEE